MVCLPIHDADYMGLSTEVGGRLGDVMQPVDPLLRLSRVCAQWQPLCIQHQRRIPTSPFWEPTVAEGGLNQVLPAHFSPFSAPFQPYFSAIW